MSARTEYGLLLLCLCAALAPLAQQVGPMQAVQVLQAAATAPAPDAFPGWPRRFENRTLTPLPLSALEQQFQQDFPGHIGRFTDGRREIIVRWISHASRRLHPAADCFKAHGYSLQPQPLLSKDHQHWSSFTATRGAEKLIVFERIHDGAGRQWSDVSAWYWAAWLGQTQGPWWAWTVAQAQ